MTCNVSFKAELKINPNLYENLPKGTPDGYVEGVTERYKKFIEHPVINRILGEDIIEISKTKIKRGHFDLLLDFINSETGEIRKSGIFGCSKITHVTFGALFRETCLYIGNKYDIKNKFWERSTDYFKRVLREAWIQTQKNKV